MSILDDDNIVVDRLHRHGELNRIKNIKAMKEFKTFASDHSNAFASLYYELFRTEYFAPLSYTGIFRYFQVDFMENPDYVHASVLISDFLKRERLIAPNSEIANMPSDALADVVRYVHNVSKREDSNIIFELLKNDKKAYADKIEALCKELFDKFRYIKHSNVVATAIISLMTGWCPILHEKFVQFTSNGKSIAKDILRAIETLEPLISLGLGAFGVSNSIWPMLIWTYVKFVINIYNNYFNS